MAGEDGIYRLYRQYPKDGCVDYRLIARFAIAGGVVRYLEDPDGILDDFIPSGRLTDQIRRRLLMLEYSGYWDLINEGDIERGHYPLLENAAAGTLSLKRPEEPEEA